MRKKSALILIQWSLGQVKHCVHVTFIQRPIAMRIDGKPLDLRCKWFLFLWECRKSPISDSALLYHRCQLILDSMALLVVLSRGLISWLRGRETKLEIGSSLPCLLQGALWCFFLAKPNHRRNIPISTILLCQPFWSFWSGRESEETLLAYVCRRRCSYVIRPKTAFILFFKSEEISLHTEVRGPQNPS